MLLIAPLLGNLVGATTKCTPWSGVCLTFRLVGNHQTKEGERFRKRLTPQTKRAARSSLGTARPRAQSTSHKTESAGFAPAPLICGIIILLCWLWHWHLRKTRVPLHQGRKSVKWNIAGCIGLPTRSVIRRPKCWCGWPTGACCALTNPTRLKSPVMEHGCGQCGTIRARSSKDGDAKSGTRTLTPKLSA